MRLHHVEICGIGPFAGRSVIDFDKLSVNGLYLLDGPTGSGKSTIIDSITWALYGKVAGGGDSTDARMRSTHADPGLESFVDLVFSVDAGVYRVRRTPEWTKQGNKNPTAVSAKLWKLSEGALESGDFELGEVLEYKAQGVGVAITELIGLNREQFVQTIVLPQGKFAEFLKLTSKDRTALLEQIFDTSLYRTLTDTLVARSGEAGQHMREAQDHFGDRISNLASALGVEAATRDEMVAQARTVELPSQATHLRLKLEEMVDQAASHAALADAESAQKQSQALAASDQLQVAVELEARLTRWTALTAQRAELTSQETSIAESERRLARHTQSQALMAYVAGLETSRNRLRAAEMAARTATRNPAGATEADLRTAEALLADLNTASGALTQLLEVQNAVVMDQERQRKDQAQIKAIRAGLDAAKLSQSELPQLIANATTQLQQANLLAATAPMCRTKLTEAKERAAKLAELTSQRESLRHQRVRAKEAADQALASAQKVHDQTEAWVASMSSLIAQDLKDGRPCPVCGSLEHPAPAPSSGIRADRASVEAANAQSKQARENLDQQDEVLQTVEREVAQLEAVVGSLTPQASEDAISAAQADLKAAEQARLTAEDLAASSNRHTKELEECTAIAQKAERDIAALEAATAERSTRIASSQLKLIEGQGPFASISERLTAHQAAVSAQRTATDLIRDVLTYRRQAAEAAESFSVALASSPFEDESEVRSASLPDHEAAQLRLTTEQYREHARSVDQSLAEPDIAGLSGREQPHVQELQLAYQEASQAHKKAVELAAELNNTSTRASMLKEEASVAWHAWQAAYQDSGPVVRLAQLAQGTGPSLTKVPLGTYVLQQRFEKVVDRANEHLLDVSLGRYELARTDEKEKGSHQQKTGLGLVVIDHLGDTAGDITRSTRSLSGGETFYVSLSLALALADVVQSENGGIKLDSLMIDEGFGSLDSATLDQVMTVLTGLANGGRSVAIVSHVDELKKMIAEQISVIPQPDGSSQLRVIA
ncbi:AAA family ATPase [Changpingibacter yushuensis]|uniref:AAA family ATPase n=1 Tax=Changpingibacter yushuensis TaxID=2758440 RepID=UPI00165E1B95|nr:SMC family ATPase [Changpingibacter yushuensis]